MFGFAFQFLGGGFVGKVGCEGGAGGLDWAYFGGWARSLRY